MSEQNGKLRIEIHLPKDEEFLSTLEDLSKKDRRLRKAFIEKLVVDKVEKYIKSKGKTK